MARIIAAINQTIDGFCDHTGMLPDEEIHDHYTHLLADGDAMLYGRTTYELMEDFWPSLVKNPSGERSMDEFAVAIDTIRKFVFSRTRDTFEWKNSRLVKEEPAAFVTQLKQEAGKTIFIGSPGLIAQLTSHNLIDEYQLCIHPVVAGGGLPLFRNMEQRRVLRLLRSKTFASGAVLHYYERC